jgi:CRISPR-associated RAMP protein (TIGR02581 family)
MSQISWSSHRILLREVEVTGTIITDAPLHIGSGRKPLLSSTVDLAVLRINILGKNVPYIPGSSLKGIFRSAAFSLAMVKKLNVCSGLSHSTCMDQEYLELGGEKLLDHIHDLLREGELSHAINVFHEKTCLLCKMFGAPSFTGHLEFSDAYPLDEEGRPLEVPLGVKTGIAVDRKTGAASWEALYEVEYVQPGVKFIFNLRGTNLPNYSLGLITKIIRMINEGWLRIGGFKTRGFGKVKFGSLTFKARGPKVDLERKVLTKMDEYDLEVDLDGLVEVQEDWLSIPVENVWKAFSKLEEAWDNAKLS